LEGCRGGGAIGYIVDAHPNKEVCCACGVFLIHPARKLVEHVLRRVAVMGKIVNLGVGKKRVVMRKQVWPCARGALPCGVAERVGDVAVEHAASSTMTILLAYPIFPAESVEEKRPVCVAGVSVSTTI